MIEEIINELAILPWVHILSSHDWLRFLSVEKELPPNEKPRLIKTLALHSGVPEQEIKDAFLKDNIPFKFFANHQKTLTNKITSFKAHGFLQSLPLEIISISRTEWHKIILRTEKEKRLKITGTFFINELSRVKQIPKRNLIQQLQLKRQPERAVVKRRREENNSDFSLQQSPIFFKEDNGFNPLILNAAAEKSAKVQPQLEETGVRAAILSPATPQRHRAKNLMRTPGRTLVRPVCDIDDTPLFKHVTPTTQEPRSKKSKKEIVESLPRLDFTHSETVTFIATLDSMVQRANVPRESLKILMGSSAKEVFRAHGIQISPQDKSSYHWSHLIAHFIADPQDLDTPSADKERSNVVPATAAANYNILGAIELFIKNKLISKATDQIHIEAKPEYDKDDEDEFIPSTIVYSLTWKEANPDGVMEEHHNIFYIKPQSHQRYTQSMHESFNTLRAAKTAKSSRKLFSIFHESSDDEINTQDEEQPEAPKPQKMN